MNGTATREKRQNLIDECRIRAVELNVIRSLFWIYSISICIHTNTHTNAHSHVHTHTSKHRWWS